MTPSTGTNAATTARRDGRRVTPPHGSPAAPDVVIAGERLLNLHDDAPTITPAARVAGEADPAGRRSLAARVADVALGHDPTARIGLARTLTASAVYAVCVAALWATVELGLADAATAAWLSLVAAWGAGGFYIAIRSGATRHFADPSLTTPQMAYAILVVALAYRLAPRMLGAMPIVLCLILVYGAFILPARRCRELGWFAVAALGCAVVSGVWQDPERFEPTRELISGLIGAVVVPTLAYLAGELSRLRIQHKAQRRELREVMTQLRALATHDELTALPNRRHVQEWMPHELARAARSNDILCIAIIDLDRFKRINDTFGHAAGDETLRTFARAAQEGLRAGDVLARWGGEEFLLVMPNTSIAAARAALERVRTRLARPETWAACPLQRVTFSAGITAIAAPQAFDDALRCADDALYRAKADGRDRIVDTGEVALPSAAVTPS